MELSIKDRDRSGQKATLECWVAGQPRLVAASELRPLAVARTEVRDDLRRQLNESVPPEQVSPYGSGAGRESTSEGPTGRAAEGV